MSIAKNIKLFLIENSIKQRTLADRIGMDYDKLSLTLNGKRKLDVEEYAKIIYVLGVSSDRFIQKRNK